jgi:hypothetical protein
VFQTCTKVMDCGVRSGYVLVTFANKTKKLVINNALLLNNRKHPDDLLLPDPTSRYWPLWHSFTTAADGVPLYCLGRL